jgi:hypothetical protein
LLKTLLELPAISIEQPRRALEMAEAMHHAYNTQKSGGGPLFNACDSSNQLNFNIKPPDLQVYFVRGNLYS